MSQITDSDWQELEAEKLRLGEYMATHAVGMTIDGRPLSNVEMAALLYWSKHSGNALVDKLIRFLQTHQPRTET